MPPHPACSYYGVKATWRATLLPMLRRWLLRMAGPLGLDLKLSDGTAGAAAEPAPTEAQQAAMVESSMAELRAELEAAMSALKQQAESADQRILEKTHELGMHRQKAIRQKNSAVLGLLADNSSRKKKKAKAATSPSPAAAAAGSKKKKKKKKKPHPPSMPPPSVTPTTPEIPAADNVGG